MSIHWFRNACSKLNVFVSYSHEYRSMAEELAQTLRNSGHKVFFDKESLPAAADYNEQIRMAIDQSDRYIFLISKSALQPGKYTLTELEFIKRRFPSPRGRVFPIIVDESVRPEDLPAYLKSVQAVLIKGNVVAEAAASVDRSRQIRGTCLTCFGVAVAVIISAAALMAWRTLSIVKQADIALPPISNIHFRPRDAPPLDVLTPNAHTGWIQSPLTITLDSVALINRNDQAPPARLQSEEVDLNIGSSVGKFQWAYVVEFLADQRCKDWLCVKNNVTVETLEPGRSTPSREVMFLPIGATPVSWQSFIDQVLDPAGPVQGKVTFRAKIDVSSGGRIAELTREFQCNIDIARARTNFIKLGFKPETNPRPQFWNPDCQTK